MSQFSNEHTCRTIREEIYSQKRGFFVCFYYMNVITLSARCLEDKKIFKDIHT